ncbi:MAG: peptide chain release factor N(5)-glutamine methyltransferase [Alphaproteobacteria bacterium]|nr:peptide chain release factor N(5)-glutamine methyltransferase [Alphaproteobacteria bacterium]
MPGLDPGIHAEPRKVHDAICDATKRLRAAGVESPRRDARLLLAEAMGVSHPALLDPSCPLSDSDSARFVDKVVRREAREPVSRIRGTREFWGLDFALSPATLDPRPDTETVIEAVLAAYASSAPPLRILDLGTGSNCILCALLHEFPAATGVGIDIEHDAIATARLNAARLGFADRASFVVADWASAIAGPFDLVVSNPPYIPRTEIASLAPEVAAFDPRRALDGGDDGLDFYRRLSPALPRLLTPTGVAAVEIGLRQAEEVGRLFSSNGLEVASVRADLSGTPRAIVARMR